MQKTSKRGVGSGAHAKVAGRWVKNQAWLLINSGGTYVVDPLFDVIVSVGLYAHDDARLELTARRSRQHGHALLQASEAHARRPRLIQGRIRGLAHGVHQYDLQLGRLLVHADALEGLSYLLCQLHDLLLKRLLLVHAVHLPLQRRPLPGESAMKFSMVTRVKYLFEPPALASLKKRSALPERSCFGLLVCSGYLIVPHPLVLAQLDCTRRGVEVPRR